MMIDTKTLKPGDEVAVTSSGYGKTTHRIRKVKKVSPTGQITLDNGSRFNTNGWLIGSDTYDRRFLQAVTDDIRESARRTDLLNRIGAFAAVIHTLPTEALRQIAAIIEANIPKEPASGE